jgi:nucleotide-binding universal stress UspA family protein
MFSYTLHVHSDGYARTRSTRVFLCASSPDESGSEALEWALECLVQDGDELIVFRGIDQEELEKDQEHVREEAKDLMRHIQDKCVEYDPDRKISIILEFIAGRVTTTLDRLIALYRPDSVVVGMRGQRRVLGFGGGRPGGMFSGVGSVSKYALSHSPVPIIVVRPESKVKKVREKRLKDPKRGTHFDE